MDKTKLNGLTGKRGADDHAGTDDHDGGVGCGVVTFGENSNAMIPTAQREVPMPSLGCVEDHGTEYAEDYRGTEVQRPAEDYHAEDPMSYLRGPDDARASLPGLDVSSSRTNPTPKTNVAPRNRAFVAEDSIGRIPTSSS
ncbi:unnamed protein product [Arabis nemorensis]|uniref:Uncharacterized protein n=1 Tax=Arabis nemorensis TaxID=586526 RepID=A0A565BU46_9BRAS|nr:unnamed protein product [Arabis nemorensis]